MIFQLGDVSGGVNEEVIVVKGCGGVRIEDGGGGWFGAEGQRSFLLFYG